MNLSLWVSSLLATDTPALPSLTLMQWALPLGWGVVCSWLVLQIAALPALRKLVMGKLEMGSRSGQAHRDAHPQAGFAFSKSGVAIVWVVVTGLMLLPGSAAPAYWLGLAFQQPSLACVALCAWAMLRKGSPSESRKPWFWAAALTVVAGWALLLDTFAVLPLQLYSLGFSPLAVLLLAALALLPWLFGLGPKAPALTYGLPAIVLTYTLLRLPTGNAWDALLDPWLWVAAHISVLRWSFGKK